MSAFSLFLSDAATAKLHARATEPTVAALPWESLNALALTPSERERACRAFTEMCFSEYQSASAMAVLSQALIQARAPLDFITTASRFVEQELLHAELFARVAMGLGGASRLEYDPATLAPRLDPALDDAQRAHELIVAYCCVSETISLHLLSETERRCTQPLLRQVLARVVKDEALHARLGWIYLAAVAPDLSAEEKARLSRVADAMLAMHDAEWAQPDATPLAVFGWDSAGAYRELSHAIVQTRVRAPLRKWLAA